MIAAGTALLVLASLAAHDPEILVLTAVEELRNAELLLDDETMAGLVAHSVTLLDDDGRVSGSFALLEPMRRLRARRGNVEELRFDSLTVRVYGASAIATYKFERRWQDQGRRQRASGWCSDVFERRDDGLWILVHRHRSRLRQMQAAPPSPSAPPQPKPSPPPA
jgi:ketosteroid isomerase-like protein